MDILVIFVLAALIGAFMIVRVILWTTNRAAESAVTRYFRASEHILETGEPPPEWLAPRRQRLIFGAAPGAVSNEEVLQQLDELRRFFEHCSFFEDEWAREQFLSQLDTTRIRWMTRDFA